jgi:hypothetical protein
VSRVGEELHEMDTSILVRREKNNKKVVHQVVIRQVNMKTSNNLLVSRSSYSHAIVKKRVIDDKIPSNDISA